MIIIPTSLRATEDLQIFAKIAYSRLGTNGG